MQLPIFDPIIFSIGPISIRWYSLAYIVGIIFTYFFLKKSNHKSKLMSEEALESWVMWSVLGIIVGGRIGYVLFYNFSYYLSNPAQIFIIWQGGMSFHGGLIGAISSMFLFAKKYKINFLKLTDIIAISAPIGLFFGRIANFINMELYGRVTDSKFGVIFANGGPLPRHPSQLYEAFLEGAVTLVILYSLSKLTSIKNKIGALSGLFLILYSCSRMFVEIFREPDEQIGFIFNYLTMGQILSLPLLIIGLILIFNIKLSHTKSSN